MVTYFSPRRVIVFGSVARGDAGADSDIDLLAIVDNDTPAEKVTLKAGFESRRTYHQLADAIPIHEAKPEPSVEELNRAVDVISRLETALRSLAPS